MDTEFLKAAAERQKSALPGLLGLTFEAPEPGVVHGSFAVAPHHMAPNGFLHAASVIALADTACGYGTMVNRPAGATGFTTIELKTNFLGTAREGLVCCTARLAHGGRMTQVWDAEVRADGAEKAMALFRCTQMILYPR